MAKKKRYPGKERRTSDRRPLVEKFAFFVVVPQKGVHRLPIHNLSEGGLAFDLDLEGEALSDFVLQKGEALDVHFYLNPSLFIPLGVRVAWIQEEETKRTIGVQISKTQTKGYRAFIAFIQVLDEISGGVKFSS